jgi:hypothetical protein
MRSLREGRPTPPLVTLPAGASYLRVEPLLDLRDIVQFPEVYDPDAEPIPLDPTTLTDVAMGATAIVRDVRGLLYRLESERVNVAESDTPIIVPLAPGASLDGAAGSPLEGAVDGALELAGLELGVSLPLGSVTSSADVGVASLSAGATADGPWTALPLDGWSARMAPGRDVLQPVPPSNVSGMAIEVDGQGNSFLYGGSSAGRVLFVSGAIDALDALVPVIANASFLEATGAAQGQTVDITMDGVRRALTIAGVVDAFPTTDPAQPLLVVDQPTLGLLRLQPTGAVRGPDEWWMTVSAGSSGEVAAALRAEPFDSPDVVSATVSARQRRTEFALLRALGLSARQLSSWLWLENGSLVLVSLVAGTIVGVVISWIALPFITVTQQAATPVPSVQVHLPWERILMLDLVMLVALAIAVGILATLLRRIGVGTILRMGED